MSLHKQIFRRLAPASARGGRQRMSGIRNTGTGILLCLLLCALLHAVPAFGAERLLIGIPRDLPPLAFLNAHDWTSVV